MWGHALVYMKIETGAKGRQITVLVHLGSSLKSKILSFLLIKNDFKIIVVASFFIKGISLENEIFEK